jgi:hypothetical protein
LSLRTEWSYLMMMRERMKRQTQKLKSILKLKAHIL